MARPGPRSIPCCCNFLAAQLRVRDTLNPATARRPCIDVLSRNYRVVPQTVFKRICPMLPEAVNDFIRIETETGLILVNMATTAGEKQAIHVAKLILSLAEKAYNRAAE